MSAIAPPPRHGKATRPDCGYSHELPEHAEKGSVILCRKCERWLLCAFHYQYSGCRVRPVKWWDLRLQARIARYLKRGDTDGEAE